MEGGGGGSLQEIQWDHRYLVITSPTGLLMVEEGVGIFMKVLEREAESSPP